VSFQFAVLISLLVTISGYSGVDLSVATTVSDWNCLVADYNTSFAIVRAYRSSGQVDTNTPTSIHNAAAAGLTDLGVYMFPCSSTSPYSTSHGITCVSAEQQVVDTLKYLEQNGVYIKRNDGRMVKLSADTTMVNRVWLDVEDESPAKYYDSDPVKNQDLIGRIVAQLESMHIDVGIYTTKTYWQNIMGNIEGYGKYPLWYPRYDGVATMDFWAPFADFTEVKIKQIGGDYGYCGHFLLIL